jgi:hypothetical protein
MREPSRASGVPLRIAPDRYRLDSQTLLTVREITPGSAAILDRVLEDRPIDDADQQIATAALARRLSGPERQAVEERAMDVAKSELQRAGWRRICRTADHKAWDYEVSDDRHTARVEVKGSTAPIGTIELTRNERDSAMGYPHSILVLVSEIELDLADLKAHGGHPRIVDLWTPAEDDLVPERFSYRVPPP